jgi:hypothetical protein
MLEDRILRCARARIEIRERASGKMGERDRRRAGEKTCVRVDDIANVRESALFFVTRSAAVAEAVEDRAVPTGPAEAATLDVMVREAMSSAKKKSLCACVLPTVLGVCVRAREKKKDFFQKQTRRCGTTRQTGRFGGEGAC